jgi:hypothetical protein
MLSAFRDVAKLCLYALALATLHVGSASAAHVTFIANGGNDANPCTAAQPCATLFGAGSVTDPGGQVTCLEGAAVVGNVLFSKSIIIDCPGVYTPNFTALSDVSNFILKVRGLTFNGLFAAAGSNGIRIGAFGGGGTLVIENCVIENFSGSAIVIEADGAFNVVIRNTRISNNASGVAINSKLGGNINVTLDRATITQNTSFGLRADGTGGGPITVAITDSTFSFNGTAGINALSGPSGDVLVNVTQSTVASNGISGVRANASGGGSTTVAVGRSNLIDNAQAWDSVGGGVLASYRNNQVIGPTGTPPTTIVLE